MGLRDIEFAEEYRSGEDDALNAFFLPAFKVAKSYDRAVGYFSSSALECFAAPFDRFVQFGGSVRLVTSVELREADVEVMRDAAVREALCEERILEVIEREFTGKAVSSGVQKLAALLEIGRLEIKIVTPQNGIGIYHEKVGIFFGDADDYVAFSGSTNESREALIHNYECIDVYPSWEVPSRARRKKDHFQALWKGVAPGATTYGFSEAAKRKLIRAIKSAPVRSRGDSEDEVAGLWPHQRDAVAEFFAKRRGILEMATGTGKTRTALSILSRLIRSSAIRTAIIAADGNDLLDQWGGDLAAVVSESYPRFRLLRHYGPHHDRDEYLLDPENTVLLCSRQALQGVLKRLDQSAKAHALMVHDEVHRFGSASHVRELDGLADAIPWRLGLSATPDREYDQAGNSFIERNVGEIIFRYPLERAIADGVLCGFDYIALEWDPSDEDRRTVQALMRRRAARAGAGEPMSEEEFRREVARVYKISVEKVPIFAAFVDGNPDALDRCIVFLAEKAYGDYVREHIHAVTPRFHTYFDVDNAAVLKEFATGIIDCLITCHRVSEGIDIRSVKTVVLLSADRARLETIQRIGRCLRTDPKDPDKRALVVDFVRRRATADGDPTTDEDRRAWLEGLAQIRRSTRDTGE
ncbi:DEAD/DEAH box helicase family protein [Azospirillum sp. SYSU D00513]|uniref:DEAD/DEAH box helicase family protein n=1 Tax=Azospirillum sp. SYSU D00513 TaxID=2812561 RepID=UPI001A9632F3|nr:DEAD/DEAH box helicase family protein [Azospirillum sp. SYSU D00513]